MTAGATQLNEKTYGQLLRRTLPHIIRYKILIGKIAFRTPAELVPVRTTR
jgi:hypothetical protein